MTVNELVRTFDNLPKIVKIILAIPALDVVWAIYRVLKSADEGNSLGIVLGVILAILGFPLLWLIDMIFIILYDRVWWF